MMDLIQSISGRGHMIPPIIGCGGGGSHVILWDDIRNVIMIIMMIIIHFQMYNMCGTIGFQPLHCVGSCIIIMMMIIRSRHSFLSQSGRLGRDGEFQTGYRAIKDTIVCIHVLQTSLFQIGDHGIDDHNRRNVTLMKEE